MDALNWDKVVRSASEAFRDGVNDWLNRAQIRGGTERGPKLTSEVNFQADIFRAITAAGAPVEIARVFAGELWSAWKEWGDGFQISPTTQPAYPLKQSLSHGEFRLRSSEIAGRLQAHLGRAAPPSLAIQRIAEWIDTSFQQWKSLAKLARSTGQVSESLKAPMGPIPSFAPMGPIPSFTAMGPIPTFRNNITTGTMMGPRFGRPIS